MKQLIFIFCLVLASASAGTKFDDELREIAEFVKQQMPCGFPALGIPPLAPYTKDLHTFDLTNRGVNLKGNLTNLTVEGLNDIDITELTYASLLLRLRFDINFKQIKIFSQYTAKGGLKIVGKPVPLVGNGDVDLVLENLRVNGSFRLRPTPRNGLEMWGFTSAVQLDGVQSKTTGVMNSPFFSNFFNQWVEEFFRILIQDYQKEINNGIGNLVVPTANGYLNNLSLAELYVIIFGFGPNTANLPVCQL